MDLIEERPPHVWIGYDDEDITIGRWQAILYENIPEYCSYCMNQGHRVHVCNVKKRDDEQKKWKEMEAEKKRKNKGEADKQELDRDQQTERQM